MHIQRNLQQLREKLQKNYKHVLHKQYTAIEAIHQILDNKRSVKKMNIGLISIGKNDDLQRINWKNPSYKSKFLKICEELIHHFDEQRDQSMRSTEKNLSEMNDEVNKMRKSLSQKGLIQKFTNIAHQHERKNNQNLSETKMLTENKQSMEQDSNPQQRNSKENTHIQNNELKQHKQTHKQQKKNENQHERQNYQEIYEPEDENNTQQGQKQQIKPQTEQLMEKERENKRKKQKQQEDHKIEKKQKQKIEKQYAEEIQIEKEKEKENEKKKSSQNKRNSQKLEKKGEQWDWQGKDQKKAQRETQKKQKGDNVQNLNHKQILKHEKNEQKQEKQLKTSILHHNKQEAQHKQKLKEVLEGQHKKKKQTEWQQIPLQEQKQKEKKNQKTGNKKLDTLPQQIDNQFYDEKAKKQQLVVEQKKSKYNPHLQIMKKQVKKKRQEHVARNQLEELYYSLQQKLVQLFAYYIKELKTNSFTFDGHPQCLDLKTFSTYYKYFKLGEICKITEIPKHFKKYSINGTWMNQQNFIQIHLVILQLGEDVIKTINQSLNQKNQFRQKYDKEIQELAKSNLPDKQKQAKQVQLDKKKAQSQKRYVEIQDKLKKINTLISQEQMKKLIRKGQKRIKSPQGLTHQYDPERLKKIVEAHSGIYRQDIILKLQQKKLEKQKKHQSKVNKILEKYKFQNNSSVNSASSFNKKNNQSAPHLRKIEGYARRNKILKHGVAGTQSIEDYESPIRQRLKSESKNKPYLLMKQTETQSKQIDNEEAKTNDKKVQVYRQLSLPKLPKRKMREQSIYESLKQIDTKAQLQFIKNLLSEKTPNSKQDQKIFNQFYRKQKQIIDKQKTTRKNQVQNRMKFS